MTFLSRLTLLSLLAALLLPTAAGAALVRSSANLAPALSDSMRKPTTELLANHPRPVAQNTLRRAKNAPLPTSETRAYLVHNKRGWLVVVVNRPRKSSTNLVEPQFFEEFGEGFPRASLLDLPRFTGKEFDPASGLYYYGARWLDPQTGRFISRDPIEATPGNGDLAFNSFSYCENSPLNKVDPTGMWAFDPSLPIATAEKKYWVVGDETLRDLATQLFESLRSEWATPEDVEYFAKSILAAHNTHVSNPIDRIIGIDDPIEKGRQIYFGQADIFSSHDRAFDFKNEGVTPNSISEDVGTVLGAMTIASLARYGIARAIGAFGVERATVQGTNVVYRSLNAAGEVQYVGITNNLARRAAEHLASKGIQVEKVIGGLSRSDARAVEQALIEIHGLERSGGTLLNRINSIATSNPIYAQQVERGYELLQTIGYR